MTRLLARASIVVLLLAATGCGAHRALPLASGSRVLVVVEDGAAGEDAAAREAAQVRALALVPLRVWPSEADSELVGELGVEPAERLGRARVAAEERRVPWILVVGQDSARLETARGGEVLWRSGLRGRGEPELRIARLLDRSLVGRARRSLLGTGEVRLAPVEVLGELRSLAVRSEWQTYAERLEELTRMWPADPGVRAHVGLRDFLTSPDDALQGLQLARSMASEAESELLAVALAAREGDNSALELRALQALVRLHPERGDYRPRLADAYEVLDDLESARAVCIEGMGLAERDELLAVLPGTPPHRAPEALSFADLAFCTGYYHFRLETWELAALAYEDAIQVYEALGRREELGESLNNAGVAMVQAERPLMAASVLRKAVDVRLELSEPIPLANSRYNLGHALAAANKLEPARMSFRRAADDYREGGEELEALETLVETLDLHVREGDGEGFEEQGEQLIEDLRSLPDGPRREEILGNTWFELGRGRLAFGDPTGSVAAYLRSLRSWEGLGRKLEAGQSHYSLALPHLALFLFEEAHTDLLRALEISVELGDSSSILAIRQQLEEIEGLMRQAGKAVPPVPEELKRWIEE